MLFRRYVLSELIFVVGFPRSGTTWFSNLINSHPDTAYRHEIFGRDYKSFGEPLFNALKYNHGLTDEEYRRALTVLLTAKVATDRPPFFKKRHHSIRNIKLQKLAWLATKAMPFLEPAYSSLFTPKPSSTMALVIKETRSSVNLASIIKGVQSNKLVILIRHPYGVIASHIKGNESGAMDASNEAYRTTWYEANQYSDYMIRHSLSKNYVLAIPETEFLAINWCIQNEDYLKIHQSHPDSQIVVYDRFLSDTASNTEKLLESLELIPHQQVSDFISESRNSDNKANILKKDASSEYFSVYRGKEFDPNKWKEILTERDLQLIDLHTRELVDQLELDNWIDK